MRFFYGMGFLLLSGTALAAPATAVNKTKVEVKTCVEKIKSFNTYLSSVRKKVARLSRKGSPSCDLQTSPTEESYHQCLKQLSRMVDFLKNIQSRVQAEFQTRSPQGLCPTSSDLPFARKLDQGLELAQLKLKALQEKPSSTKNQAARHNPRYGTWQLRQCLQDVRKVVQSSLSLSQGEEEGDMYLVFQNRAAFRVHGSYVTWLSEQCLQNLPEEQSSLPEGAQIREQVQTHQKHTDKMLKKSDSLLLSSKKQMCQSGSDPHLSRLCESEELTPSLGYSLHLACKNTRRPGGKIKPPAGL